MTNINCSLNCMFQQDGKCCYEVIADATLSNRFDCIYFKEKLAD